MPSITCLQQCCSWLGISPAAESSVFISLHGLLGFAPLSPLVWGADPWSRDRRGFLMLSRFKLGSTEEFCPSSCLALG